MSEDTGALASEDVHDTKAHVRACEEAVRLVRLEMTRSKAQSDKEIAELREELAAFLERNNQLKLQNEALLENEQELTAYRKAYETEREDSKRLADRNQDLVAENRRLRDNQQSWLDKNRDLTVKVQTLMEVIESLR